MIEDDPLTIALTWRNDGYDVALATVVATWGSAPRPAGSMMAVRSDGAFAGSVSAGCVEAAVVEAARAALAEDQLRQVSFGVPDAAAWSVGLSCGGKIEILIEPLTGPTARADIAAWTAMCRAGARALRAVDFETGHSRVLDRRNVDDPLAAAFAKYTTSGRVMVDGRSWFITVLDPPVDLVLVGAVHIAQALAAMTAPLGYRTRVIDPRALFATPERFPGISLVHAYPDEVFARSPLSPMSAVVALAHDPKIDDPALIAALSSPAFYVGALGSQKTQTARRARLLEYGVGTDDLDRLHGPVGLPIGSKAPAEIAVSILADIIATLRRNTHDQL